MLSPAKIPDETSVSDFYPNMIPIPSTSITLCIIYRHNDYTLETQKHERR